MNLRTLPNAIIRNVVEFRANLKDNMEKANAGFPIVVTRNDDPVCVLISPEQAQGLFGEGSTSTIPNLPDAIEVEPLVVEDEYYDVADDEEDEIVPEAPTADAVGIPSLVDESPPTDAESLNNPPSVEEASAEVVEQAAPAGVSEEELEDCPGCVNPEADEHPENPIHAVPSKQHPTQESLESTDEVVAEVEDSVAEEAPVVAAVENAPVTDEAKDENGNFGAPMAEPEEVTCGIMAYNEALLCLRPAVRQIRFSNVEFNICQHHLDQLVAKEKEFETLSETPVVSS